MFRLPLRGLDLYRTRGQAATVVNLRRRLTRSEAAKQEAESQTNRGRTKFPRDRVQEVRHLATTLTAGLSFDTLFSLILNFARSLSLVQVDSSGFLHITKYVWGMKRSKKKFTAPRNDVFEVLPGTGCWPWCLLDDCFLFCSHSHLACLEKVDISLS